MHTIITADDGALWPVCGDMAIGMAIADKVDGPYTVMTPEPLFSTETFGEIEDPYMWCDEDGFHLLAKDQRGTITGEHGNGILAHSADALHWELDAEPLAYTRYVTFDDGTQRKLGNLERCSGLFDENGKLTHLFFAVWEDERGFGCNKGTLPAWNMSVPLRRQVAE